MSWTIIWTVTMPAWYSPRHIVETWWKLYVASSWTSNLRYIDLSTFTLNSTVIALWQSFNTGITV